MALIRTGLRAGFYGGLKEFIRMNEGALIITVALRGSLPVDDSGAISRHFSSSDPHEELFV